MPGQHRLTSDRSEQVEQVRQLRSQLLVAQSEIHSLSFKANAAERETELLKEALRKATAGQEAAMPSAIPSAKMMLSWVNSRVAGSKASSIADLRDGTVLLGLLEGLGAEHGSPNKVGSYARTPTQSQWTENCQTALDFIDQEGIGLGSISSSDIASGDEDKTLQLLFQLIQRYHLGVGKPLSQSKSELVAWVKSMIPSHQISGFSASEWNDGTALNALIHAVSHGELSGAAELANAHAKSREEYVRNWAAGLSLAHDKMAIPKLIDPADPRKADPTDPAVAEADLMMYISCFRHVLGSNYESIDAASWANDLFDLPSRDTCADHCNASGDGVTLVRLFEPAAFLIHACDATGQAQTHGGDIFKVAISQNGRPVTCSGGLLRVANHGSGALRLLDALLIHIEDCAIDVADFMWELDRTYTGRLSRAELSRGLINKAITFTIPEMDEFMTLFEQNQDGQIDYNDLSQLLQCATRHSDDVESVVTDLGTGSYRAQYIMTKNIGPFDVEITLRDRHIKGSPYRVDWRLDTEPNTPRSNSQELLLGAQAPPRQKRPSYVGSDASKEKRQRSFETVPELHLDDWLAETVQAEDLEKIRWLLAAANIQIKLAYRWYACMAVIYENVRVGVRLRVHARTIFPGGDVQVHRAVDTPK